MKWLAPADSADRHGNSMSRMPVQKVDDTKPVQQHLLHGFAGEQMDTIEHMHPYGFVNVPQKPTGEGEKAEGAEGMTLFMGSNRSHAINVASGDRRFRLYKLADGEVALHDDQGHQVHIKRDGVHVSAPNSKKIVMQIMDDDKLPQDSKADANGVKLNQIQQAGRPAAINMTLDKNSLTINHAKDLVFNCNSFTVNAKADIKLVAAGNALLKGVAATLYATANAFIKAVGNVNSKGAANLATPPWVDGASDPPNAG